MIVQPTLHEIILLCGCSGSGKNEVAKKIVAEVGKEHVNHIELDMFYIDRSNLSREERDKLNYDDPNDSLEWYEIFHFVMCLMEGLPATYPFYDFDNHIRVLMKYIKILPKRYNILNSQMALWLLQLRKLARRKIFVDADLDICFGRRLERDTKPVSEGGRGRAADSVRKQWIQVREAFKLHFEPTKKFADIIIPEGGFNDTGISYITGWMKYQLLIEAQQKSKRSHKKK